jgi:predicted ArsR family transcriptional regulator
MQKTRQKILEYLRQHGEATVEDLSQALNDLTPVTVRHHLDVLRSQGMVGSPEIRHRTTPGRPRYVYTLTDKAQALFPNNINALTSHLLGEMLDTLEDRQINVIFDGIATRMASDLGPAPAGESFEARLERVVEHLTNHGYEARLEAHPQGFVLHTTNCPYMGLVDDHQELCGLDVRYISQLLGAVPRRIAHKMEGEDSCSYLVMHPQATTA